MDLFILILFAVSLVSLACGLWRAYRDMYRVPVDAGPVPAPPTPPDEDMLIFDRVTAALAKRPRMTDPRAVQAVEAEVMREVGEQYGLSAADVETIYRRVWQWRHGIQW